MMRMRINGGKISRSANCRFVRRYLNTSFVVLLMLLLLFSVAFSPIGSAVELEKPLSGDKTLLDLPGDSDAPSGPPPTLPDDGDVPDDNDIPDDGDVPDDNVPDDNVPDDNVPDDNVPDNDVPDDNVPDNDVPDDNVPDDNVPDNDIPDDRVNEDFSDAGNGDEELEEETDEGNMGISSPKGIDKIDLYYFEFDEELVIPGESSNYELEKNVDAIGLKIDGKCYYLFDTDRDGELDTFYNPYQPIKTKLEKNGESEHLIDLDGDKEWDYLYNSADGSVKEFGEKSSENFSQISSVAFLTIAIIVIAILCHWIYKDQKSLLRKQKSS